MLTNTQILKSTLKHVLIHKYLHYLVLLSINCALRVIKGKTKKQSKQKKYLNTNVKKGKYQRLEVG